MGRWLDAADSVKPSSKWKGCQLHWFLDGLVADERADLLVVFERAAEIPLGMGRYTYVRDVIVAGGGPNIHADLIADHLECRDKCPTS